MARYSPQTLVRGALAASLAASLFIYAPTHAETVVTDDGVTSVSGKVTNTLGEVVSGVKVELFADDDVDRSNPLAMTFTGTDGTYLFDGSGGAAPGGPCDGLVREAEDGTLSGAMTSVADAGASGGAYVEVPDGFGNRWSPGSGNAVELCFLVQDAGLYRIDTLVQGVDGDGDSFFVSVDGGAAMTWDTKIADTFKHDAVKDRYGPDPATIYLAAGEHRVRFDLREDGTRLDRVSLTKVAGGLPEGCYVVRFMTIDGGVFTNGEATFETSGCATAEHPATGLDAVVEVPTAKTVANDDSVTVTEGDPVSLDAVANDDPSADVDRVEVISSDCDGVTLGADGMLTGTPTASCKITYKLISTSGSSDTAMITITVNPAPIPTVADDDAFNATVGTPVSFDVVLNDQLSEGFDEVIELTNGCVGLTLGSDGFVTGTPTAPGVCVITYMLISTSGSSDTAVVVVTVDPLPVPTVANDDVVTVTEGEALSFDVVANDDPSADVDRVEVVSSDCDGVTLGADGMLTGTPTASCKITYRLISTSGSTDTAMVTITVEEKPCDVVYDETVVIGQILSFTAMSKYDSNNLHQFVATYPGNWYYQMVFKRSELGIPNEDRAIAMRSPRYDEVMSTDPTFRKPHTSPHRAVQRDLNPDYDWIYFQHWLVKAEYRWSKAYATAHYPELRERMPEFDVFITYKRPDASTYELRFCVQTPTKFWWRVTPVAVDLNDNGEIGLGDGRVDFDFAGDGNAIDTSWLSGEGDGFLVDNRDGQAASDMNGTRLFGDQGGRFEDGYEDLATRFDTDGDGSVSGDELSGLALWIDDGDAVVEAGELVDVATAGLASISTEAADDNGFLRSQATTTSGRTLMTEDVMLG